MPTTTRTAALPLVSMLSRLEAAYLAEFDHRLRTSEFCSLSLAHSRNVLRHLGDGPQRASNLVELSGVTKQAISQQIVQLERVGLVRTEPDPADQRARLVVLTERGGRAMELVRKTFRDIEEDWGRHLGDGELAALRDRLGALLERTTSDTELEPEC
ncbi:MarR family winged helix-turn-helix transcriptional regulator [Pseudactinotalea suaedae]|uniref:MarR family winged helix-turn-helix transcriptional regulator n=1 Tax=Pseudactinotalea suaedae TaxID=1524924 RepID=UPI0012E164EB|nr:MarR family winged helix-turn-helix transcriptional regulator [Pseudactinotalea suaedae]